MNLAKLYIVNKDNYPEDYSLVWKNGRTFHSSYAFRNICKKCHKVASKASSYRNGLGLVFILECHKCNRTHKIQMTEHKFEHNKLLGKAYDDIRDSKRP